MAQGGKKNKNKNKHNRGGFKSIGSQVGSNLGGHLSKQGKLKGGGKGFNKAGNLTFSGFKNMLGGFFGNPANALGTATGLANQATKAPPSQAKINRFLKHNIDITKLNPSFRINIDGERALKGFTSKIPNENIRNWVNNWAPSSLKNLKINHQMYSPTKLNPGDKGWTPQGTGSAKIDPKAEQYLEWMARQNPTGKTVSDMEKIYANNLKDGKHTLEQVMKMNPSNTIPFYALIDDKEESTPTKNNSVKVNNTKENKNMSPLMGPLALTAAAKAAVPLTVGAKKTYKSNATTDNQKRLDTLYQKHFDRSGDHSTQGGASYWLDEHKPQTDADWDNIDRMLGASAEAKSPGNLGGVSRDSSTMFQGDKGQEYLDSFRGDGSLVGLNSANTLNQIAANTGQAGNYFQQSDQGIIDRIDNTVNPPVTPQPVTPDPVTPDPVTPDPGKDKGGMDDFMKFMMLMSVMGGGRGFGGGGGYGGSQYGYGGLNPGGVQAAYNPLEHLQGMGDWFKNNFGSGVQGGTTLTT